MMHSLSIAIQNGQLGRTGDTLDTLIGLFAPRLSRAKSQAVPKAFKDFWQSCFTEVNASEMSEDVFAFLNDVLSAVPAMITVKGLDSEILMSEVSFFRLDVFRRYG
jgi:hypothetical protein